ncbi:galactose-1-phosphate uridylyltransferase [Nesterenkonia muleiensis]|uniref:galactose-1-phosphate uridylyltransferase n=1 Tax=Nesterenkonia muleiensis TaxID=2282648 RepID=UPI000E74FEB4|nr:galactose-1-phosphate uridylyltransferase [Nesterenkonia muleiensis]
MNRTRAQLADGREIFFYDDEPRTRQVSDQREIARQPGDTQLRFDPLLREWVAVASGRQQRTHLPSADKCPLCPSSDGRATEIPQPDYDVVVFENRFPSFSGGGGLPEPAEDIVQLTSAEPGGMGGVRREGAGRCEVVCFAADHVSSLAQQTPRRMRTVIDAWADRTEALMASGDVDQVYCFENRGEEIGVTLHHPHGQIYGYPFVTPRTSRMLSSSAAYRSRQGADLFEDILEAERAAQERIVASTEHWTAFVPEWARWPVEICVYPHRGVRVLPELTDAERGDFAALYLELLGKGDRVFAMNLPYISGWQQAPASAEGTDFRLHLQLFSIRRAENKLKYLAGSESGMGVFINDIPPEQMAQRLREA